MISNVTAPAYVEHLHGATGEEEIEKVIEKIEALYDSQEGISWQDFAVLLRANNQANAFIQKMGQKGIPYTYLASRGLYSKQVIMDLLSYLRLISHFHDSVSLFRVLSFEFLEISVSDIMTLLHYSRKKTYSLFETLRLVAVLPVSSDTQKKVQKLVSLIEKHAGLAKTHSILKMAYSFIHDFDYLCFLEKKGAAGYHENLHYLNQFFKIIDLFQKNKVGAGLVDFIRYMDWVEEAGDEGGLGLDPEAGPDTVKIMTVHASKGLEFKYVFLVNLVDQRFPTIRKSEVIAIPNDLVKEPVREGDVHMEEERRLFYVAMTRAKQGLFFCSASNYGGTRKKKLSRFLMELGYSEEGIQETKETDLKEQFLRKTEKRIQTQTCVLKIPNQFSFTQLKVFDTCPWQYRYAHLLKVPIPGRAGFSFGQTMHLTLQRFFEQIKERGSRQQASLFEAQGGKAEPPGLEELLGLFEVFWVDDWYLDSKQKKEYKIKGKKILKDFYQKYAPCFPVPLFIEKEFRLKVGGSTLIGKIDRIDLLEDGKVEVLDYKTGKVPENEKKIDPWSKNQLYIYQMAVESLLNKQVGKVTFYYLQENKPISFLGTPEQLDEVREKIKERIAQIQTSRFDPTPKPFACRYCDFKGICQYRRLN